MKRGISFLKLGFDAECDKTNFFKRLFLWRAKKNWKEKSVNYQNGKYKHKEALKIFSKEGNDQTLNKMIWVRERIKLRKNRNRKKRQPDKILNQKWISNIIDLILFFINNNHFPNSLLNASDFVHFSIILKSLWIEKKYFLKK